MNSDLSRKLGVKAGDRVCLVDAPPDSAAALKEAFPPGVTVREGPGNDRHDLLFFWPREQPGLAQEFEDLQWRIRPEGAIWVLMPKRKFAAACGVNLTWEEMQAAALHTDLVDNKVASISDQEYGTRLVIRKELRDKYFEKPG